jgi:PST family polysaccharide transporter
VAERHTDEGSLPDSGPSRNGPPSEAALGLRRRARIGAILLGLRTVVQQLVVFGGMVWLARLLGPKEYGTFWIVQFALQFFTFFGDAGLGAALIQQKTPPTVSELSTVFWAQLAIGLGVLALVYVAAPFAVTFWPDLPERGATLLRTLSLGFLLVILRGLPALLMERELQFGRLAALDVLLTLAFYGTAVVLAWLGWGVQALVVAVLVQGAVGVVAAFVLRPFVPALVFDRARFAPVLRFGIAFQTKNAIGFVNGATMPVLGGRFLGAREFGLVSWSQNTAWFSLKLVEILARVNFPLFSRLQDQPEEFARTLERSVRLCAVATFFMVSIFLGLGPGLIQVLYGERWLDALPMLYVFALVITIGFVSPIFAGALDAVGRPQIVMRLSVVWTVVNWLALTVAMWLSPTKLAFALGLSVHVVLGNLAVIVVMKQMFPSTRFLPVVRACIVACALVAVAARFLALPWVRGPVTLVLALTGSAAMFALVYAAIDLRGARAAIDNLRRKPSSALP